MKTNKFIFVLLFIGMSVAGKPYIGLWRQIGLNQHFYTEVFFHAELNHWQFEYTSYLVDLRGNITKKISMTQWIEGTYYRLPGDFNSIILCRVEKFLTNGKVTNFKDKKGKAFVFAFRVTNDSTATFGRVLGLDIYESYKFKKKDE
jgi:hypothetical protein